MSAARLPSIRARLSNALLLWSLAWGVGVAVAVGLAAQREVDELLDESLHSTAQVLAQALSYAGSGNDATPLPASEEGEFAWQLVNAAGSVVQRSSNAPAEALQRVATAGLSDVPGWRVFGRATGRDGFMLYVAHTNRERSEARSEVALSAALAALSIGLVGLVWLRFRVRRELQPLERLSERLQRHDPLDRSHTLGPAERAELVPVHAAIDDLGERLARRLAHERAFSAHAAHALRTPLAGVEAQLAIAMREAPPAVQARLRRVREATGRLQRVVRSLLDLFRVSDELQRRTVGLESLLAQLPVEGLAVSVDPTAHVDADPDLLAAALANLLDNAQRHGASKVLASLPTPYTVRVEDDGPGVSAAQLATLRAALATQDYENHGGLGLMLADLVARRHGGMLRLPDVAQGFVADLVLGPSDLAAS
jgi:signal transduction histidine kinase